MRIKLDHTILWAHDRDATAAYLEEVLGLPATPAGPFLALRLDNDVTLDVGVGNAEIDPQHYAFQVSEQAFDEIHGRIRQRGQDWWADPGRTRPGEVYTRDGGRRVYFQDPNQHLLEIFTQPR